MADRVRLLIDFYHALPRDRVKVETSKYGFDYLSGLLRDGAALDYGELTLSGTLHKYKLSGVPAAQYEELVAAHVAKRCNVCQYFGAAENALLCFNLDNNRTENNTEVIPEMASAVRLLRAEMQQRNLVPLVIASGRGYHLWCRLKEPVPNVRLHQAMLDMAVRVLAGVHGEGGDRRKVKFNFYPDPRTDNTVSLRLFGSDHAKNRVFSRVLADTGLLDEEESWAYFEEHLRRHGACPPP